MERSSLSTWRSGFRASESGIVGVLVMLIAWLGLAGCAAAPRTTTGVVGPVLTVDDGRQLMLERIVDSDTVRHRGRKLTRWVTGRQQPELFTRPYGVAWDQEALLVTDPGAGRVVRVDERGRTRRSPDGMLDTPIGIARCAPGILVTDARRGDVSLLDENLRQVERLAEGLDRPTGLACEGDRAFVVETGRHRVLVLDLAGLAKSGTSTDQAPQSWGVRGAEPGQFNFPSSLSLDGGALWIGDTLNFRIQLLDAEAGSHLATFGHLGDAPGEMPRIKGVAVDIDGQLWVSDAHLDQVSLFSSDGTFLTYLGGRGSRPGEFSFPAGVAAHPDGRVVVVDSLNRRLQVFRLAPPMTGEGAS